MKRAALLAFLSALMLASTVDNAIARCSGCSCRGGPGFRSPNGRCVGWKDFVRICGPAPHTLCKDERPKRRTTAPPLPVDGAGPTAKFATIARGCQMR